MDEENDVPVHENSFSTSNCSVSFRDSSGALLNRVHVNVTKTDAKDMKYSPYIPEIKPMPKAYFFLKRLFDVVSSICAIVVLSPLLIVTSVLVKCTSRGPVFYISTRVGENGKKFKMVKFRSMDNDAEKNLADVMELNETCGPTFKSKNDPRVTKFGKYIRRTSIDELPQLFNILSGSMSFVGPRPALPMEVAKYGRYERLRLIAKPGLTCIWQCSGRSNVPFEKWMDMDVEYLQKRGYVFDLKLILKTFAAVLKRDGAE